MRRAAAAVAFVLGLGAEALFGTSAVAAELTAGDYRFLKAQMGMDEKAVRKDIKSEYWLSLHGVINSSEMTLYDKKRAIGLFVFSSESGSSEETK